MKLYFLSQDEPVLFQKQSIDSKFLWSQELIKVQEDAKVDQSSQVELVSFVKEKTADHTL